MILDDFIWCSAYLHLLEGISTQMSLVQKVQRRKLPQKWRALALAARHIQGQAQL